MRRETINVYMFDELSDEAKEKAREQWREHVLFDEWWDDIEMDAEMIGLEIESFDLDHGTIAGKFTEHADTVANLILENHGENTDTYRDAQKFRQDKAEFIAHVEKDEDGEPVNYEDENTVEEIKDEFKRALLESYFVMLRGELEWLMSDEQVDETILANEYEFTEDGKVF